MAVAIGEVVGGARNKKQSINNRLLGAINRMDHEVLGCSLIQLRAVIGLLRTICLRCGGESSFARQATIASSFDGGAVSVRTVGRYIQHAVRLGLLEVTERTGAGGRRTNRYDINIEAISAASKLSDRSDSLSERSDSLAERKSSLESPTHKEPPPSIENTEPAPPKVEPKEEEVVADKPKEQEKPSSPRRRPALVPSGLWAEVAEQLRERGVACWRRVADWAAVSVDRAKSMIAHFDRCKGAWGSGGLWQAITTGVFPQESTEWKQQRDKAQAIRDRLHEEAKEFDDPQEVIDRVVAEVLGEQKLFRFATDSERAALAGARSERMCA